MYESRLNTPELYESEMINPEDVKLFDETAIDHETLERRMSIAHELQELPDDVLDRLLILQGSVGCLNRCVFCSQGAGNQVRWLSEESLDDVFGASQAVMRAKDIPALGAGRDHKPKVVFPYLDNDIASYPHLDRYTELAAQVGSRVRLTTVGYARHNTQLQYMHERLANELEPAIDGIRFSWTPYTFAWAMSEHRPEVSREEYIADFANALSTYRPLLEAKGPGRDSCCIEMRSKPCIETDDNGMRVEMMRDGGAVISVGPYTVLGFNSEEFRHQTEIVSLDQSKPGLSNHGVRSLLLAGTDIGRISEAEFDSLREEFDAGKFGADYEVIEVQGRKVLAKACTTFRFANEDGSYYAVDPFQLESGEFSALHLYPQTDTRPAAGYADSQRPIMNEIINHKARMGYGPKDIVEKAEHSDLEAVVAELQHKAKFYEDYLPHLASHIQKEVLPMAEGIVKVFRLSGLPAELFFHRHFLVDTGQIVNQGRAYEAHFSKLASRRDMPLTPNEVKGYGADLSLSAVRGNVWAIDFATADVGSLGRAATGLKQQTVGAVALGTGLVVREWSPVTYDNVGPDGEPLRRYFIPAALSTHSAGVSQASSERLIPGIVMQL